MYRAGQAGTTKSNKKLTITFKSHAHLETMSKMPATQKDSRKTVGGAAHIWYLLLRKE